MRILFLAPTYKPAYVYGGVTVVTSLLAESLVKAGHDVTVYTTNGNGLAELDMKTGEEVLINGVKVVYFKRFSRGHSHLSPAFWAKIFFNAQEFDVVHLHSWWNPAIVIAAAVCKLRGIRPILSPHGMFCEYILFTNNKRKKQLLHFIAGRSLLRNSFLHVSSEMEWNESQHFLKQKWPGCVIPNLVESAFQEERSSKGQEGPLVIGFLSRIDPKKRLDMLMRALSAVKFVFKLRIAGDGHEEYLQYLKALAVECGISDKVEWVGWQDNIQKYNFYRSLDLFALLSHNENFGVVVLEALSVGTPVMLSGDVGLSKYVQNKELGWVIEKDDLTDVVQTLELIEADQKNRLRIQQDAPGLVVRDFNSKALTDQYIEFYKSVYQKPILTSEVSL
jgi:glycosyltransferase involved in cell wall biosynthesis